MAVLAVDPGTDKCGLVVMGDDGAVKVREIIESNALIDRIKELVSRYQVRVVLMGNGTGAKQYRRWLSEAKVDGMVDSVVMVDEYRTSEMARRRYLMENRRGWRRFWPLSLQVPPEAYDDYVALILAERYLQDRRER